MNIAQKHTRFMGLSVILNFRPAKLPKLGITVTKQYGNAVHRNLFKRHAREAFRQNRHLLPPLELIILPKKGGVVPDLSTITRDLLELAHAQSPATESR